MNFVLDVLKDRRNVWRDKRNVLRGKKTTDRTKNFKSLCDVR